MDIAPRRPTPRSSGATEVRKVAHLSPIRSARYCAGGDIAGAMSATLSCALLFAFLAAPLARALPPAEALKQFRLEPGYIIELAAAEPLVQSPCALAWDERGRLFICENRGYPTGAADGSPQGRVAMLEDCNNDGQLDKRTDFATGLGYPNSLLPWQGGLLVTDAPDLLWLRDTNSDGRADIREVWFTGFATNQTTQLRACYPTLGPDGWIYVSRGWNAGVVSSPKWTNLAPVDLKNGDFRFRPDGSAAEAIGGNSQFGMVLDDAGRRFSVSNRNPIMHSVGMPAWWQRMPGFSFSDVVQDVSPTGTKARVHPISADMTTSGFFTNYFDGPHNGTFTSACGLHQYFGEALGPEMQGSWFVCEPAQNLVQRQVMEADGPTFRSRAVPEDRDFLASSDPGFHPVSTWTGPDGALYLADMCRKTIDHPEYLPKEVRPRFDFDGGKDLGRIWRIRKEGMPLKKVSAPFTPDQPIQELAQSLLSSNIWTRQTAHRLLLERNPVDAINAVGAILNPAFQFDPKPEKGEKDEDAFKRFASRCAEADPPSGLHLNHARMFQLLFERMKVASGPEQRSPGGVQFQIFRIWFAATFAESPTVREVAWRAMQPLSTRGNPIPDVGGGLLQIWAADPSAAVRFHLAYCLGQGDYSRMTDALVMILKASPDRWTRAMVLSGLQERQREFVETFFSEKFRELRNAPPFPPGLDDSPGMVAFAEELGRLCGSTGNGAQELWKQAVRAENAAWPFAALRGLAQGRAQKLPSGTSALAELSHFMSGDDPALKLSFDLMTDRAIKIAGDVLTPATNRVPAVSFLGDLEFERAGAPLIALLTPAQPKDVQMAAARALGKFDSAEAGRALASREHWTACTPAVRELALNSLLGQAKQLPALFDGIEAGHISAWSVPANRRQQLLNHGHTPIKERAQKLFSQSGPSDRRKVYEDYKSVLSLKGDAKNGRAVFQRACANCHQLDGEGSPVGPDLTGLRNQPAEALLLHILAPDEEVYPGYQSYNCETKDGRTFSGILAADTESSITLRRALGEEDVIPRSQIAALTASRTSLMPSDLEKTMSRQELADLIAALKSPQPVPK